MSDTFVVFSPLIKSTQGKILERAEPALKPEPTTSLAGREHWVLPTHVPVIPLSDSTPG